MARNTIKSDQSKFDALKKLRFNLLFKLYLESVNKPDFSANLSIFLKEVLALSTVLEWYTSKCLALISTVLEWYTSKCLALISTVLEWYTSKSDPTSIVSPLIPDE